MELKQQVYECLKRIPKGKVTTYGQIARFLGNKHLARTVGNILHANPNKEQYPCYKVVNSKGCLADNYAFGGAEKQQELLQKDGIEVKNKKVDLKIYGYTF